MREKLRVMPDTGTSESIGKVRRISRVAVTTGQVIYSFGEWPWPTSLSVVQWTLHHGYPHPPPCRQLSPVKTALLLFKQKLTASLPVSKHKHHHHGSLMGIAHPYRRFFSSQVPQTSISVSLPSVSLQLVRSRMYFHTLLKLLHVVSLRLCQTRRAEIVSNPLYVFLESGITGFFFRKLLYPDCWLT